MIRIEHLKKAYPNITPLKDVSVTINKGDVISIIGPSGTGKSTLIRCINMLEKPTSGTIYVDGECITDKKTDISKIRRKMSMVFQSFNLFEHLSVIENIMAAPVDMLGKTKKEAYEKGIELLSMVGLADKALSYPDELSGGQKQRVAIARALAMDPKIILLDEPTSALDPTMVGEVQSVIKELAKKGLTMMIVTHEMSFARYIANRVFYMDDGGIYEEGTPEEIFDNPQKERTIRFIRHLKVFERTIKSKTFDFLGFNTDFEEFGRKNHISQSSIYRTQAAFEEICTQIILPKLREEFALNVVIEYSSEEKTVKMQIKYTGKVFNPCDTDNLLSLTIARNSAKTIEHKEIDDGEFTNLVVVEIKED